MLWESLAILCYFTVMVYIPTRSLRCGFVKFLTIVLSWPRGCLSHSVSSYNPYQSQLFELFVVPLLLSVQTSDNQADLCNKFFFGGGVRV